MHNVNKHTVVRHSVDTQLSGKPNQTIVNKNYHVWHVLEDIHNKLSMPNLPNQISLRMCNPAFKET